MLETNILDEMNKIQNNYYETNGKNTFFKKTQKLNCAKEIADKFELNDLIEKTMYVIPNTNQVYIDYTIFKLYANPDNFNDIILHIIELFSYCIKYYGSFTVCMNLKSFSISAAERYKIIIQYFCDECLKSDTKFVELLDKFYIYHTPHVMETISKLFSSLVDPAVYQKIVMHSKEESDKLLQQLLVII